jgi:hypothetical protein
MRYFLAFALLASQAGYSWGQSNEPVPEPAKRLGLCQFSLDGTSSRGVVGGAVGGAIGGAIAGGPAPYFGQINKEVQGVYGTAFAESALFQKLSDVELVTFESGKIVSLTGTADKNKLAACVSAKSYWAAKVGWNKRLAIITKWEIIGRGKCKAKVTTSVASNETHGKFPGGTDPALKAPYLELAKDDAKQFLDALPMALRKAQCEDWVSLSE